APAPTPTSSTVPPSGRAARAAASEGVSSVRATAASAAAVNTAGSKKWGVWGAPARMSSGTAHAASISAQRPAGVMRKVYANGTLTVEHVFDTVRSMAVRLADVARMVDEALATFDPELFSGDDCATAGRDCC